MKNLYVKCKKIIAVSVLSIMAVCTAAQTAEAACEMGILGRASSSRASTGYRCSANGKYWSKTHGHDYDENGHAYNVHAYSKLHHETNYIHKQGTGEVTCESYPTTAIGTAQHKFVSGSGFTREWSQN